MFLKRKKPFPCYKCEANFARKTHLNGNIASLHEGEKLYECDICHQKFAQKGHLNGHVASVHEKRSPLNVSHVIQSLLKMVNYIVIFCQFMKEGSPLNVKLVILDFSRRIL